MALSLSDWGPLGPWGEAGSWEALPGQVHIDSSQKYRLGKGRTSAKLCLSEGTPSARELSWADWGSSSLLPLPEGLAGHFT